MKDILTTLELLTKEKIDPETVLEEGEIEEVLTISEDGELNEATPGSMGTAYGDNLWRVEEVAGVGFQAYIWDDDEWVEVGEPGVDYTTHEEAERYAKNMKYETDRYASKTEYMK
jgi:hypothetical protein|tara:strand:- start:913 stop:1257 length:345 start_codon:yes stop_codon:yes gene_type:complete